MQKCDTSSPIICLGCCQAKLALKLPETRPFPTVLQLYFVPLISDSFPNSFSWYEICESTITGIAKFCSDKFHWDAERVKQKFTAALWDSVFLRLLYFVSFLLFVWFEGVSIDKYCGKSLSLFCAATQLETSYLDFSYKPESFKSSGSFKRESSQMQKKKKKKNREGSPFQPRILCR